MSVKLKLNNADAYAYAYAYGYGYANRRTVVSGGNRLTIEVSVFYLSKTEQGRQDPIGRLMSGSDYGISLLGQGDFILTPVYRCLR